MFSPGEGYPSETAAPSASPTVSPDPSSNTTALSSGAVAGIVTGGIAMMVLIGIVLLMCRQKKKRTSHSRNAPQESPSYVPQSPVQQHLEPYRTMNSPKPPPLGDISPESYLGFPYPSPFSPGTTHYLIPQRQVVPLYNLMCMNISLWSLVINAVQRTDDRNLLLLKSIQPHRTKKSIKTILFQWFSTMWIGTR